MAEVGGIFSTDAPFAKSILLHVFISVALHVAMYSTTKYCCNRAISSSYISLFCCTDASFTNTFVTSEQDFYASQKIFLFLPNIDEVVSQPVRAWKKGRPLADIAPMFDTILWTGVLFKSFPFLNSTHNSCNLSIRWYTDIVITTTSLSTVLTSILLFDWAMFLHEEVCVSLIF